MKVAVIGGGGFRTPGVWESLATVAGDVGIDRVVLKDRSADRLALVAAVIEGLRRERGGTSPPVETTTALDRALDGSAVVLCAIRVGGLEGRIVDETVPLEFGVLGQETVGPGGIAFALRTVPVVAQIAETTARLAPDAWFLNLTNPAGLVTEAIRPMLGERAIGVCDSPAALCGRVLSALGGPAGLIAFDYGGLNHAGWLLGVDRDGTDLLPSLLADDGRVVAIDEVRLFGAQAVRTWGVIPNEYLAYYERPTEIVQAFRRAGATRGQALLTQQAEFFTLQNASPRTALEAWRRTQEIRHGTYMAEVRGPEDHRAPASDEVSAVASHGPGDAGYAAIVSDFLRSVTGPGDAPLILDVANRGRIAFLDDDAVVEVSCSVQPTGARPLPGRPLPPPQRDLVERLKHVERTTIRAAREGSAALALEAIASHPVVPSRKVAERILSGYLRGHEGLRSRLR